MLKYTSGPWVYCDGGVFGPDGYMVAKPYTTLEDDGSLMEANAGLIAGAPDMAEALRLVLSTFADDDFLPFSTGDHAMTVARVALRKATGEGP